MNLQDIKDYFCQSSPQLAPKELAAAYVAYAIAQTNSYGSGLIQDFEGTQAPGWGLSERNLCAALMLLESHNLIVSYWAVPIEGRQYPRQMYRAVAGREDELKELGKLFAQWRIKNIGGWG